jgi:hypothetical protein
VISSRRFLTVLSTLLVSGCALVPTVAAAEAVPVGEAPPLPAGATPLGALPPQQEVNLYVALEPRDPAALAGFATEVSTPGSPVYGQYLSVDQFADRFGAAPAAVAAVRGALQARGLTVGHASANNLSLQVEATAAEAEAALGTGFERVRTADGRVAFANTSAPELPAAAAPYVAGVIGLDDLSPPQSQVAKRATAAEPATGPGAPRTAGTSAILTGGPQPCADALQTREEFESGYTADQIASAYGLSGYYAAGNFGAGQTIALLEEEPYLPADIEEFQKCYGTHATVEPVDIEGGPGPYKEKDGGESELDIEQLIGLAPEAKIVVYQGPNKNSTQAQILSAYVTENVAKVMSSSWGLCEEETDMAEFSTIGTLLQEAAAQGQSFFVAAGDAGATDCYEKENPDKTITVDYPGSDPFATDVGGTRLEQATAPIVQYIWSDGATSGGAGGGGVSAHWGMPSYQSSALASLNVVSPLAAGTTCGLPGYCREVPDVSAEADPDTSYVVFTEEKWGETGGTSAAAPLWAAFATLANASPACGGKAIGFANPALYAIGGTAYDANFDDVISSRPGGLRSNDMFDDTKPFFPGPHYDMATGIGTPIGTALGDSLCAIANPPVPPAPPASTPSGSASSAPNSTPAPTPTPAHLKTLRLAGTAKGAPKLTLGLEARPGSRLEAVTIALPPGLTAAQTKKALAAGIAAHSAGKRLKIAVRTVGKSIQIRLPSGPSTVTLRIVAPALTVTDKLRDRVKSGKTKKLGLVVTTRESGGANSRFPLTLGV